MTLKVRWVPDAVADMQAGHDWYAEREPDLGLAQDFAVEVFDAIDTALRFPLAPRRYEHVNLADLAEVRKIQLERFNEYGIVYTVLNDTLWILAVAHAKRRPGYWLDRVHDLG